MTEPVRHFEDSQPGDVMERRSRTIGKESIIAFARAFDPQVFHVAAEAPRHTIDGGLLWRMARWRSR